MGPFPDGLKAEIKKLHPDLADSDLAEYLRLVDATQYIDPSESPEAKQKAEQELARFVKMHLPKLDEAQTAYAEKMRAAYEASHAPKLLDPIDIALADRRVAKWLRERAVKLGSYSSESKLVHPPSTYLITFSFGNGSTLEARVDQAKRRVYPDFKRMIN